MGIRLIKILSSILMMITLTTCAVKQESLDGHTKEQYILAYKKEVLFGCLNEKTENKFGKLLNDYNNVGSVEVAILFHSVANHADSVGREYSRKIKPYDYYGDLIGKSPIFGECVEYAFSIRTDSIATDLYFRTR